MVSRGELNYKALSEHFRVTAFVDVLGWSELTGGIDSLVLRRMRREASLRPDEVEAAERLKGQIATATRLDGTIQRIIGELRALATPLSDVKGVPDAKRFFENRHVTFVRSSDNIFLHSASFRWTSLFVSELMKRGLNQGLLMRAGISCGVVVHSQAAASLALDPRSQDISIFGDGITTAVAAEKAAHGLGERALIHGRLLDLIGDHDVDAIEKTLLAEHEIHQLRWWADFAELWPDAEWVEECTRPTKGWFDETLMRLRTHPDFDWNRRSPKGRTKIEDTILLLEANRPNQPADE